MVPFLGDVMLIEDLIGKSSPIGTREAQILESNCSQFLQSSGRLPVFRLLPTTYNDFHKVKVRFQKKQTQMNEVFNKAFSEYYNLRQRAIFAYGQCPQICEGMEPFYVFPINGFKFLYSREVKNSNNDYQQVLETLFEQFQDNDAALEIATDLLKYTYVRENLYEAIISDSEIIFYGVPFYYAIRVNSVSNYTKIFQ